MSNDLLRDVIRLEKAVEELRTQESDYSPGAFIGNLLALPELRGLWIGSSVDESGRLMDISGQGRHLTNNGGAGRLMLTSGMPYTLLDGTTQYFSRADEAGLDITGALTIGGWFSASAIAVSALAAKDNTVNQRGYSLLMGGAGDAIMNVFASGTTATSVTSTNAAITTDQFFFAVGRFTPSSELAIFLNGTWTKRTTTIPASTFNSNAPFTLGALADPAFYLAGRLGACFVCAAAPPDAVISRLYSSSRYLYV